MSRLGRYLLGICIVGFGLGYCSWGHTEKYAVLVGVGQYKHSKIQRLTGPPKDVDKMEKFLREFHGFKHIRILKNEQATKANILKALRWLAGVAGPNQPAVFYFSGHGSRVTDTNGDEPDGLDETLVPYDAGPDPASQVIDDEIYLWIKTVKSRRLTIIFDSCHSGTGYKNLAFGFQGQVNQMMQAKHFPGFRRIDVKKRKPRRRQQRMNFHTRPRPNPRQGRPEDRMVFVAASRDFEFAYDVGGHINSVMTHFLIATATRYPNESVSRLIQRVNRALVSADGSRRWPMTPNAEGRVRERLFFSRGRRPAPTTPLLSLAHPRSQTSATRCKKGFCATLVLFDKNMKQTSTFRNGEELRFSIKLNKPGFVALVDQEDGVVSEIFPDEYYKKLKQPRGNHKIPGQTWYVLPPNGSESKGKFEASGKGGEISLIASPSGKDFLRLSRAFKGSSAYKGVVVVLRNQAQQAPTRSRVVAVTLRYKVVP